MLGGNGRIYFHQFYNTTMRPSTMHSLRFSLRAYSRVAGEGTIFPSNVRVPGARAAIFDGEELIQVIYLDNHPPVGTETSRFYTTRLGTYYIEISAPGFQTVRRVDGSGGERIHRQRIGTLRREGITYTGSHYSGHINQVNISVRFEPVDVLLGDINNDEVINILDLQFLHRHVNSRELLTDERQLLAADVNQDGEVDILDLRILLQYVNQRRDSLN